MFISQDRRIVYLAPPRTGSTSISEQLSKEPFNARIVGHETLPHLTTWHPQIQDYTAILSVRHPYTRAISLWRKICISAVLPPVDRLTRAWRRAFATGIPNFEGFLRYPELQESLNTHWRCSWHQERVPRPVDFVVHLERFDEDLAKIPKLKDVKFPRFNAGPPLQQPWYSFYEQNPTCLQLVQRLWADDFDEYGYTRDLDQCCTGKFFVENSTC